MMCVWCQKDKTVMEEVTVKQPLYGHIFEIDHEKQEITVKAIRDQLGTGSFLTISKHLQAWKKLNQKNPIPEIPTAVLKASQKF